MAAPDITLGFKEVLLTQSSSVLGVISIDNKTQFGVVAKVSDLCDRFTVGDYVTYDPAKGRILLYGSTQYIFINEDNISGEEVSPP